MHFFTSSIISLTLLICLFLEPVNAQSSAETEFDIKKVHKALKKSLNRLDTSGVQNPQNQVQVADQDEPGGTRYFVLILRILGYLFLLSILIMAGIWLMKRFGLSGTSRLGGGSMDILEALSVGPNRSIMLVRVMDSVLILAHTAQKIEMLDKIEGEKAIEIIASTKGGTSIVQFKDVFNNFFKKSKIKN